jgi:hypothetical protein
VGLDVAEITRRSKRCQLTFAKFVTRVVGVGAVVSEFTASETALDHGINDPAGFEAVAKQTPSEDKTRGRSLTSRCGDRVVGKGRPENRRVTIV